METISVAQARQPQSAGKRARVNGWIRTRRDSKGGFSFLEVNDGSSMANLQVIADQSLPNYDSDVLRLTAGCSVTLEGEIKQSSGKGQATEIHAEQILVHGWSDPEKYPSEETTLIRKTARVGPLAAAHQHVRRRGESAQPGFPLDPQFLPGTWLSVRAHAHHYGQ